MITMRIFLLTILFWITAPGAWSLEPIPAAPAIGRIIAQMLGEAHYNRRPIDAEMSKQFLRNYIESYDYSHSFFTQADIDEFENAYATTLGQRLERGDLRAAEHIFNRFMIRLKQRQEQVRILTSSTMTFTEEESMPSDLHKQPWPADEAAMAERWRLTVKHELLRGKLDGRASTDTVKSVISNFDSVLENYNQLDANDVLQRFFSALCRVYDPHTDYFAAPNEANFDISMRLMLVGIGARLRYEKGYTSIVELVPGGPAAVDGRLQPGDKIEAVAQGDDGEFVNAVGMKIDSLVQIIRGEKGTVVRLRIIAASALDPAERETIRLVRDVIHLRDQEAKAKLLTLSPPGGEAKKVGVIRLPSFYSDIRSPDEGKSTTRDVRTLLESLQRKGMEGLVLDLRGNGGGSLKEAISLTGLFAGNGPVVQVKNTMGQIRRLDSEETQTAYNGPLVILTSRNSASASEILAGALQDYGRAVVVGEKSTFGKGTVQSVIGLDRFMPPAFRDFKSGAVHLTIQMFYRISGESTQNRGVIPDIGLPSIANEMEISEAALPNALPYHEIPPASYELRGQVAKLLPSLKNASAARVSASYEWGFRRADIERYRSHVKENSVSLNLEKRLAEKEADKKRDFDRKKERAARGPLKQEELEITLEELDGVVPSTTTVKEAGTDTDKPKAPPVPDMMLVESTNILADMIAASQANAFEPALRR